MTTALKLKLLPTPKNHRGIKTEKEEEGETKKGESKTGGGIAYSKYLMKKEVIKGGPRHTRKGGGTKEYKATVSFEAFIHNNKKRGRGKKERRTEFDHQVFLCREEE